MGGLDNPTAGELYIDGKLIDFTNEKNLDAYRNEDVGFVFQDHNLMDDFNIIDNIKMSLTTQNKDVNDNQIDEILKLVDLEDIKNKMPNEISGGQRQRISIARTLIKNPKILLADEPTGNLDSTNSKRIFEILKNLSKNNLVLVVTHDLDSAYVYGDRIIELKDGKIISDLIKTNEFDLNKLKENYSKEVEKSFEKNIKKTHTPKIKDNSKRDTTSKLTFKNAFHIMITWLKKSRVSFIISVLILAIALGGFGVVNTITRFNFNDALAKTLSYASTTSAMIIKGNIDKEKYQLNASGETFTYNEYNNILQEFNDVFKEFPLVYSFDKYFDDIDEKYQNRINGIVELGDDFSSDLKLFYNSKLVAGVIPQDNDNYIEIIISDYLADSVLNFGTTLTEGVVYPNTSYENLLNKTFSHNLVDYKIVGIYKCQYSDLYCQEYEKIKDNKSYKFAKQYIYPVAITNNNAVKNYALNSILFKTSVDLKADGDLSFFNYYSILMAADMVSEVNELVNTYYSNIVWAEDFSSQTISDNNIIISYSKYLEIFDKYEFDTNGDLISNFSNLTPEELNDLTIIEKIGADAYNEYKVIAVFKDIPLIQNLLLVNNNVKIQHIEKNIEMSNC